VSFTDLSTGEITKWEWDFNGDQIIDSTYFEPINPAYYFYNNNGYYTVSLTVTGPGGTDQMIRTNYIYVSGCG
jgi:PKD repeat protein